MGASSFQGWFWRRDVKQQWKVSEEAHKHSGTQDHRHRDTQAHRHTGTQAQAHRHTTHRHTGTHAHRHTHICTLCCLCCLTVFNPNLSLACVRCLRKMWTAWAVAGPWEAQLGGRAGPGRQGPFLGKRSSGAGAGPRDARSQISGWGQPTETLHVAVSCTCPLCAEKLA